MARIVISTIVVVCLANILPGCGSRAAKPAAAVPTIPIHPVFNTRITGASRARPAIQVDVHDESEHFFFRAELYLSVQSSRFPSDTQIILPVNVRDFSGCRTRFVQLPFEVQEGDVLAFNLLDDDELTDAQQDLVIGACRAGGYCIIIGTTLYSGPVSRIVSPAVMAGSEALGAAIVTDIRIHSFEHVGSAEFHVPNTLPNSPNQANELALLRDRYARASVKVYGPGDALTFEKAALRVASYEK